MSALEGGSREHRSAFWLIMSVGGAVLLGVALTYGLISRRGRRADKTDPPRKRDATEDTVHKRIW